MSSVFCFLLSVFCFLLTSCATIYNPATERQEFILIDTGLEVTIGQNVARSVARQYKIIEEPSLAARIQSVGDKIAKVSDRQNLPYRFYVISQDDVNAFAAPGGYIFIHKGLLDKIDSDDELAGVLAHEVGHIAARHSVKQLQGALGYDILMSLAFRGGRAKDVERLVNITFDLIQAGFSRKDELEADRLAVRYTHKAGYNPKAMVTFLKKLQGLEKHKPLQIELFLRTHPFIPQRIEAIEEELKKFSSQ